MATTALRLLGVDGVNVCDIAALDSGIRRIVGKELDPEREGGTHGWHCADEPAAAMCAGKDASSHLTFYRRAVENGELLCADSETASALGLPFKRPPPRARFSPPAPAPTGGDS